MLFIQFYMPLDNLKINLITLDTRVCSHTGVILLKKLNRDGQKALTETVFVTVSVERSR